MLLACKGSLELKAGTVPKHPFLLHSSPQCQMRFCLNYINIFLRKERAFFEVTSHCSKPLLQKKPLISYDLQVFLFICLGYGFLFFFQFYVVLTAFSLKSPCNYYFSVPWVQCECFFQCVCSAVELQGFFFAKTWRNFKWVGNSKREDSLGNFLCEVSFGSNSSKPADFSFHSPSASHLLLLLGFCILVI